MIIRTVTVFCLQLRFVIASLSTLASIYLRLHRLNDLPSLKLLIPSLRLDFRFHYVNPHVCHHHHHHHC